MRKIYGNAYDEIAKILEEWTEKKIKKKELDYYPSFFIVKIEMKYEWEEKSETVLALFEFCETTFHFYDSIMDFWERQEEVALVAIQPITLEEFECKYQV